MTVPPPPGVPVRKEFGASLLRSTWTLSAPGLDARGQERRPVPDPRLDLRVAAAMAVAPEALQSR